MGRFREISFLAFIITDLIVMRARKKFTDNCESRGYRIVTQMVYEYFSSLLGLIWIIALSQQFSDFKYPLLLVVCFLLHLFFTFRIRKKNLSFFIGEDEVFKFMTNLLFYTSVISSAFIVFLFMLLFYFK